MDKAKFVHHRTHCISDQIFKRNLREAGSQLPLKFMSFFLLPFLASAVSRLHPRVDCTSVNPFKVPG